MNTISTVMTIVGTALTAIGLFLTIVQPWRKKERGKIAKETVELLIPVMSKLLNLGVLTEETAVRAAEIALRKQREWQREHSGQPVTISVREQIVVASVAAVISEVQAPQTEKITGRVDPPGTGGAGT